MFLPYNRVHKERKGSLQGRPSPENPPRHLVHIVFLVGHWTKCAKNGNIWPKMTKNTDLGPNLAVFGPKILNFMGVRKRFGTNITENHLDNLSALFFDQFLDQMGQNADIWPKMPVLGQILPFLGPKSNFLGARSKNFGTLISRFQ